MPKIVLIRHVVEDYQTWKSVFDANLPVAQQHGLTNLHILRDTISPNHMTILFKVHDSKKARAFLTSDFLKEKMQHAGVYSWPEIYFLTYAEK